MKMEDGRLRRHGENEVIDVRGMLSALSEHAVEKRMGKVPGCRKRYRELRSGKRIVRRCVIISVTTVAVAAIFSMPDAVFILATRSSSR